MEKRLWMLKTADFEKMAEAGMTQQQKISEKPCSEMPDITGTGAESAEKTRQSAGDAKNPG